MTDKKLLELAAKAAGKDHLFWNDGKTTAYYSGSLFYMTTPGSHTPWNPLTNDGDALRLAVKLKLGFEIDFDRIDVYHENGLSITEYRYEKPTPTDQYAATRRAIVRAAAEIGKEMK